MSEAERLCDRIYLLHEGRIADHGRLAEILSRAGCDNLTDAFLNYARAARTAASSPAV
jgi:ABC-type Na+ transport system ATPase subunit NatA